MVRNRYNIPGIIKYSFWDLAYHNDRAVYACLNQDDPRIPKELEERAIGIGGDCAKVIAALAEDEGGEGA